MSPRRRVLPQLADAVGVAVWIVDELLSRDYPDPGRQGEQGCQVGIDDPDLVEAEVTKPR